MKKLLFIIISIISFSCNSIDHPIDNRGRIVAVSEGNDGRFYIKIEFVSLLDPMVKEHYLFLGSDTCKVGQFVNIK